MEKDTELVKVSNSTDCRDLAGKVSRFLLDGKTVILQSIGKIALNNSMKGVIITKTFLASNSDKKININPYFETRKMPEKVTGDENITVICLKLHLI